MKKFFFSVFILKLKNALFGGSTNFFTISLKKFLEFLKKEISTLHPSVHISILQYEHCDKSRGDFRAVPRSAAGTKWYITEVF